jgi:ubiquinone/menaquinone biosynthesis C-methylase UbiE
VRPAGIWEELALGWARFARTEDVAYSWNGPAFLELLPPPGRLTVDVGCGEGRVDRELAARGHRVVGVDVSPTLVRLAQEADPAGDYRVGEAASLPLPDEAADLVVAFMSLQDVEDLEGAIGEAARVLEPGGRLCLAILHPVATAGRFEDGDATFAIRGSYVDSFLQTFPMQHELDVPSFHRSIEGYSRALEGAGFLVERLRELPTRRRAPGRIPTFLHVRALKP